MENNPDVSVVQNDESSWIRIGDRNSDPKLKESNTDDFMYVGKPLNNAFTIGYEGCWNTTGITVMDNFIEIHFVTTDGDTISSGKDVGKGRTICVEPICDSVSPTSGPVKLPGSQVLSPTAPPSVPPSANPSKMCIDEWDSCEKEGSSSSCCDGTKCTKVGKSEYKCLEQKKNSIFLRG